jgi:hypothetical protein
MPEPTRGKRPQPNPRTRRLNLPALGALSIGVVVAFGVIFWFAPAISQRGVEVAGVPAPPAFYAVTYFPLHPHERACMNAVTIEPQARIAQFRVLPAHGARSGGPKVELILTAGAYRTTAFVPTGYAGGEAHLAIRPPAHPELGDACWVNRGSKTALLSGTVEPRTVARPQLTLGGRAVLGDVALEFTDNRELSLPGWVNEMFGHASNLTDGLVPVALIWLLAIALIVAVPSGLVAAFYLALREDEAALDG